MNPLFHPLTIFFVSNLVFTLTAAYTSRESELRYAALVFFVLPAYALPFCLASYAQTTGWVGRVPAGAVAWNIVSCFDRLILRGWDYEHYGPSTKSDPNKQDGKIPRKSGSDSIKYQGSRMDFAGEVTGCARGVGLFWEVKNVPRFSNARPSFVPSKVAFLFVQSVAAIACYYSHNATVEAMLNVDRNYLDATRIPFLTRLSEVSFPELKARVIAALGYWIVQHNMLQFFYSIFGIIGVIFNPSDIGLWRPTFGSFADAYNIRNYWGLVICLKSPQLEVKSTNICRKSWHQNLRSGCEGLSNFAAHDMLHLPRYGLLQRYTKIFCSFLISGIMHARADTGGGMSMRESGAIQFFCMQAVGIIIEDAVRNVYSTYCNSNSSFGATMLKKAIGYTWVLFFLVWTTPVWVFPAILNMRPEDAQLSWAAVKPVFVGR